MRFFTSDNHWKHANILKYCPMRKYKTIEEHDSKHIDLWNSVVKPEDEVWTLGDWAFADLKEIARINKLLNGTIHLVIGNHDRHTWADYIRAGFASVQKYKFMNIEGVGPVGLAHDPAACITDRSIPWLVGHMHQQFLRMGNAINVGLDVRGMKPVSEEELKEDFRIIAISIKHDFKESAIARKEILGEEHA